MQSDLGSIAKSMPTSRDFPAQEVGSGGRGFGDGGAVARSSPPAGLPPAGQVVVLRPDAEVGDLVAQRVAVDAERAGGTAEVAPVGLQGGDDELPFKFTPSLLQRHAPAYELIDDLIQASIEILFGHERLPRERKSAEANSLAQAPGVPQAPVGPRRDYFGSSRSPSRIGYRDSMIFATENRLWTESTASSPMTIGGRPGWFPR